MVVPVNRGYHEGMRSPAPAAARIARAALPDRPPVNRRQRPLPPVAADRAAALEPDGSHRSGTPGHAPSGLPGVRIITHPPKSRTMSSRYLNGILLAALLAVASCTSAGGAAADLTAEEWFEKGARLSQQGRYAEALEAQESALALDPTMTDAWLNRGYVCMKLGNYTGAVEAADRVIQLEPGYAGGWNTRGRALFEMGNYTAALACYERAVALQPDSGLYWQNLGNDQDALGNRTAAGEARARAGALEPANAEGRQQQDRDRASQTTRAAGGPSALLAALAAGGAGIAAGRRPRR